MSSKGQGDTAIITPTINVYLYFEILYNSLILPIENCFGDDEVIFQDNNASSHKGN